MGWVIDALMWIAGIALVLSIATIVIFPFAAVWSMASYIGKVMAMRLMFKQFRNKEEDEGEEA